MATGTNRRKVLGVEGKVKNDMRNGKWNREG
jgi:hypothetical protein